MMLVMVAFWGFVAWVVVTLLRSSGSPRPNRRDAEDVLDERFARGEIDEDEYRQRRDTLQSR
jgi:putative membrane protein